MGGGRRKLLLPPHPQPSHLQSYLAQLSIGWAAEPDAIGGSGGGEGEGEGRNSLAREGWAKKHTVPSLARPSASRLRRRSKMSLPVDPRGPFKP